MDRRVVITGMGIVSPIGCDLDTYRQNLLDGICGIGSITRFDTAEFKVKVAAEVKDFDPLQYMSKIEVKQTDLFTRFAIGAACQAMTQSGLGEEIDRDRFGVYFGSGIGGFTTFMEEYDTMQKRGNARVSPHFVPKMISNIAAGQIAIRFGAKGPCVSVTTACATGTNAIGEAYRAIRHGYADVVISGGSEASINPLSVAGFQNCMALTQTEDPARASIPFDKDRSGFVMGEGSAVVILEELEHAKTRGAKIYAEVIGYGCSSDAYHITSPAEDGSGAAKAMENAVNDGGVSKEDITYINAHGTSTHHNDLFETRAIKLAFGDHAKNLKINSTKSMVGHLLGAAGALEFVTCVKEIEEGFIHKTVGLQQPDEELDLNYCMESYNEEVPYALSNSLGFGGHNASILLKKFEA